MTTPANAVLDAFNDAWEGHDAIAASYSDAAILNRLAAARSRTISLFDEIANFHGLSRQGLIDLCNARAAQTNSGGIGAC